MVDEIELLGGIKLVNYERYSPESYRPGCILVLRNSEKAGTICWYHRIGEPVYITLSGTKPKSKEEAELRVGKDVIKLSYCDILYMSDKLGLLDRYKSKALEYLSFLVFPEEVLDSMDNISHVLGIKLTAGEYESIRDLIYYDPDVEGALSLHPVEVVRRLIKVSDRFLNSYLMLLYCSYSEYLVSFNIDGIRKYLNNPSLVDFIVDYKISHGCYKECVAEYGFSGTLEVLYEEGSLSGYNTGTIQVDYSDDLTLIDYTYALPPDDYGEECLVLKGHIDNIKLIFDLIDIGRIYDLLTDIRSVYSKCGEYLLP